MIADSSALIIFAKLNRIDILLNLFKKIEVSEEVYKEAILDGLEKKFEDSLILKNCLDKGQIKIIKLKDKHHKLSNRLQYFCNIGPGEAQAISLAKQLNRKELIVDEALARGAAKSFGLKPIGSLRVLLIAYTEDLLGEKELKEIINKMVKLKFRIGASTLIRFWELFERIEK